MLYMCLVVVCMIYIYNYIQLNDMVEKKTTINMVMKWRYDFDTMVI